MAMQVNPSGLEDLRRTLARHERIIHSLLGVARLGEIWRGRSIQFQDPDGSLNLLLGDGVARFYNNDGVLNAQIGAGYSSFFDALGALTVQIGANKARFFNNGFATAVLGQFDGRYYDADAAAWIADTVRGLGLFRDGDEFPFFSAGHAEGANRLDVTAGFNQGPNERLQSFQIDAHHTTLHGGDDPDAQGRLSMQPTGEVILEADGSTLYLGFSTSNVTLSVGGAGGFTAFNLGTHATPANLSRGGDASIRVVSSALKYKADIQPLVVDRDELFSMAAISYLDKGEKEAYERQLAEGVDEPLFGSEAERDSWVEAGSPMPELKPPTRYPGFIADEWAKCKTLRQFVRFEDDEVEGFHYDRVGPVLLEIAKDQQSQIKDLQTIALAHEHRIEQLEAESAELKARLEAIESRLADPQ